MRRVIEWSLALLGLLALTAFIFAVTTAAHAQVKAPRSQFIEDLTVGHFRSWDETAQAGYVLGVYSYAQYVGVRCPSRMTVGEYQAALIHNKVDLHDSDLLPKAMLALFARNGCGVEK